MVATCYNNERREKVCLKKYRFYLCVYYLQLELQGVVGKKN